MAQRYTDARREANERYNAKAYKSFSLYLRVDDDKEIIKDLEQAKEQGSSTREWLSDLFYKARK